MSDITNEIKKRRTFAIISHPDAGKTTLTEKFLLYGGAINQAGSVKGKATAGFLGGYLPDPDGGGFRGHGHRRVKGSGGADEETVQGLRYAPHPDLYVHQQDGPGRKGYL